MNQSSGSSLAMRSLNAILLMLLCSLTISAIPVEKDFQSLISQMIVLVNHERALQKLPPLKFSQTLSYYAVVHSKDMAEGSVAFGHGGFDKRSASFLKAGQHSLFGENVAFNKGYADPLTIAHDGLMKSKSHRVNILGDFNEIGIGIAYSKEGRFYVTQLFAKSIK